MRDYPILVHSPICAFPCYSSARFLARGIVRRVARTLFLTTALMFQILPATVHEDMRER